MYLTPTNVPLSKHLLYRVYCPMENAHTKIGSVVWLSSVAHRHKQQKTTVNTSPTLLNPLRSDGHMVGESPGTVNIGIQPTPTFGA